MTYNERVRSRAEEMAPLSYAHFHKASPDVQEHWILSMYPLAEIAVKHEGDAFDEGKRTAIMNADFRTGDINGHLTNIVKHDLGLIKPK